VREPLPPNEFPAITDNASSLQRYITVHRERIHMSSLENDLSLHLFIRAQACLSAAHEDRWVRSSLTRMANEFQFANTF
jgi:hypothetical protein